MMDRRLVLLPAVVLALGAAAACGGFTVTKVPSDKTKAEETKGIRYYMPWPYLAVTKEFPVDTATCFVTGTIVSNGQYINLDPTTTKFLNEGGPQPAQIPTASLTTQGAQLQAGMERLNKAGATPGGGKKGGGGGDGGTGDTDGGSKEGGADDNKDGGGIEGGGGSSDVSITGGTGTQPIQLSDSLSMVYLPNEQEQYAVELSGASQSAQIQLTGGWMAEAFNVKIDNTEVFKLVESAVNAVVPTIVKLIPGLQAGVTSLESGGASAVPVTVKVHTVRYAVPGLYPLLHANELSAAIQAEGTKRAADSYKPCDPSLQQSTSVRIGAFVLQTRGERYLEVAAVASTTGGGAADGKAPPKDTPNTDCVTTAKSQLIDWAAQKLKPPIDLTGDVQAHVLSATNGDNVKIAIEFKAGAKKGDALNRLGRVKGSDLSGGSCSFKDAVTVCELGKAGCS
jgi:hypothetical protein